jgi:hypothetical protein
MNDRKPRYGMEEFARRGNEIYETDIRSNVEETASGKIVAIDIETREYEIADDTLQATDRLYARLPNAQIWCVRVGQHGVYRIGHRARRAHA